MNNSSYRSICKVKLILLVCLIGIIITILLHSRAFCIGFIAACWFLIWKNSQNNKTKILTWGVLSIITLSVIVALFIKTDSTLGRILIYKISFEMFRDHWLTGIGINQFNLHYLYRQAEYFAKGGYTEKEMLLADNTQHAFNDYWEFIIETGLAGIFTLVTLIIMFSSLIRRSLAKKTKYDNLLLLSIIQLVVISIAALFTHVFEQFIFQFLFIISISIITGLTYPSKHTLLTIITLLGILAISYCKWGNYLQNFASYQRMKEAKSLYRTGYIKDAFVIYNQLYPTLENDANFLVDYADVLSTYGSYKEAENMMLRVLNKQCNSNYYDKLAQYYYRNGKIGEAEQSYLTAVHMVPNRFLTRYNLFVFYTNTNQRKKAAYTKKEILSLKPKVPSTIIDHMLKRLTNN